MNIKSPLQRRPLAAYRLRREIDALEVQLAAANNPSAMHDTIEVELGDLYAEWGVLTYPGRQLISGL